MSTTTNILLKDTDGNWYSIPEHLRSAFEEMRGEIDDAAFVSDEWFTAHSNFNDAFGKYATA